MNLTKLFEMQRKLDERIVREKGLEGQSLLDKKILALQVELGELANEWRGFKFWSKDQEPRIKDYKQIKCKWCNGSGDDGTGVCPDCKSSGDVYKKYNPLLEEYVDCLHFILSIGLELGFEKEQFGRNHRGFKNTTILFTKLIGISEVFLYSESHDWENYKRLMSLFFQLGEMLGFTPEQVESAYYEKNAENHRRQEVGY